MAAGAVSLAAALTLFLITQWMEGQGGITGDAIDLMVRTAPAADTVILGADVGARTASLEQPALLILSPRRDVAVTLDGISAPGRSASPGPAKFKPYDPHFIALPHRGANLSITVQARGLPPTIHSAYLAEAEAIGHAFRSRRFFGVDLVTAATGVAAFAGVLALATALVGSQRWLLGGFGALMMTWAARNFTLVGGSARMDDIAAERLSIGLSAALLIAGLTFITAWARAPARLAVIGGGALLLGFVGLSYLGRTELAISATQLVFASGLAAITFLLFKRSLTGESGVLAEVYFLLIGLLAATSDILATLGLDQALFPKPGLTLPYSAMGAMPVALAMILHLARRARDEQRALANRNALLQTELTARETEIAAAYAAREEAMREAALTDERRRIMRDMHDGFGGQLFGLAASLKRADVVAPGDVADDILAIIDEVRLMVDSLDTAGDDLAIALAAFRARAQPKIEAAGLSFDWRIDDAATRMGLEAGQVLDIFRILQEACANTLRHAAAAHLTIRFQSSPDGAVLMVEDDGVGLASDAPEGKGLANMRARAAALGARLSLEDADPGLRVILQL